MNVSAACPQCGTIANPNDKFCNTCGTPLQRAGAPGAPPPQAAPQAPPPQAYAPPPRSSTGRSPRRGTRSKGTRSQARIRSQDSRRGSHRRRQHGAPHGGAATVALPARSRDHAGHELLLAGAPHRPRRHAVRRGSQRGVCARSSSAATAAAAVRPSGVRRPAAGGRFPLRRPAGAPPAQGPGFGGPPPQYQPQQPPPQQGYGGPPPGAYPQPAPQPAPQGVFQPAAVPPPQALYAPPPPPGTQPADAATQLPGGKILRGFLVSFQGNASGEFWPLYTGRLTVGRAPTLPSPPTSRSPTRPSPRATPRSPIDAQRASWSRTRSSTNGTYVNEEHIGPNGRRELRDGDRVRFGGYTTLVKILGRLG